MLIHAKLNVIEEKVEKLLHSEITIKEISEDTGISESILKKLSSGEQSISNAKYGTIQRLYNYYIEHSDNIALHSNRISDYSQVKLPKKMRDLITDIDKAIEDVNQNKQTVILEVKDVIGLGLDETTEPRGVS
ncbi:hypothetical protein [Staphylococcus warneri]|uniref:hypothetical protein n=1 Tax=Staphylococcus warneri TaxID=1292 RepID=UPI001A8D68B2|nr:hypothetical protein [Staphylococcus warneri]MBO0377092.1 hypothetical protein [Staphylococcus warneri]